VLHVLELVQEDHGAAPIFYYTQCYTNGVPQTSSKSVSKSAIASKTRAFKTLHFSKTAGKQGISDAELCQVVAELDQGKGDNLGGNVWKNA